MKVYLTIIILFFTSFSFAQEDAQEAFDLGVKLLKIEHFQEAGKIFSMAIEKGEAPEGLKMAYIYKAYCLNGLGKYNEAIDNFTHAIEIDSTDLNTYTERGLAHSYLEDYNDAIEDFKKVLTIDSAGPQVEMAFYNLARIKMLQSANKASINYLDQLINLTPKNADAYFLRGFAKSNLSDIDGSIKDFDLAIMYNPRHWEAYSNRAIQKLNKIPTRKKNRKRIRCIEDPCEDLLYAKFLGDSTIDDLIEKYCSKCK